MSASRRGATGLSGLILIDKPAGMTSHDVVAAVRRATGEGRVGHAGTLDPMATGLLVVLVGPATRLEPYLSSATKAYDAEISFGTATDTDDAEGMVVEAAPVPEAIGDPAWAQRLLDGFLGDSEQVPPAYSAIKTDGRVAHRVMRAGGSVAPRPRPVRVDEARLLDIDAERMCWRVAFTVSKGTYIRSLARDIGLAAGTRAHLSALARTRSGPLDLTDALPLGDVESRLRDGSSHGPWADPVIASHGLWADPVIALGLPVVTVTPHDVADGRALPADRAPSLKDGESAAVVGGDPCRLLGVYRRRGDRLVPTAVLAGGVTRGER